MKQNILIIPDVHGRSFWKTALDSGRYSKVIFLGDYVDPYEVEGIDNLTALSNFKDIDTTSPEAAVQISQLDEMTLIEEILNQREMEFMAEAKRWYDLLWLGRVGGGKYKTQFINKVVEGNQTTNQQWIRSVLQDENAWYLPIPQADIEHNKLLEQNPYYSSSK